MSDLVASIPLCSRCNSFTMSDSHTYPPVSINDFRSNVVPSTEVHAQISKIIGNEDRELSRYGQEIARLRRIVDQLELERSTLQTRITQRRSFISSRRRIPSELWSKIFDLACGSEKYSLFVDYDSGVRVALPSLLSRVSTQWRAIMRSLPHLWSSISIDLRLHEKLGIHALLEQYLRNAADFPLTLHIKYSGPCHYHEFPGNSLAALQLLFRNIARCKALDIVNYNTPIMAFVPVPPTAVSFPLLQSIKVYRLSREENPQFWDNVRVAPRLTHATIAAGRSSFRLLPLGKLVSLHLQTVTFSEPILDILRECSSLQTLKMTRLRRGDLNLPAGQTVTMPSLQSLSLEFWKFTSNIEALLSALMLPSLHSLELSQESGYQDVVRVVPLLLTMLPFSQSLTKMSFNLKRLIFSRGSIVQLFHALPRLTDLEISGETDPELEDASSLHELLLVLGADSSVAPQLRSLRLREHYTPFEVQLVEAAIALLEEQVRPLKCIQLHFQGYNQQLPAELLARMRKLKERGIECIVGFKNMY